MTVEPVLECRDVRRSYGSRVALDGLTLSVEPKTVYGLLGPNGAGKTTLLSILSGLMDPDAGEVLVAGRPMSRRARDLRGLIGLVPQDIALYADMTARQNLMFFGRLYGMSKAELRPRIEEVLELVSLADRGDEPVESYSGGMKRRINVAAALLHRPTLLLLDEPTVGVDPQSRSLMFDMFMGLASDGAAVILASHQIDEVERVCDRVGIVDHGRLLTEGTPAGLIAGSGAAGRMRIAVNSQADRLAVACRELEGVTTATATVEDVEIVAADAGSVLPRVLEKADRLGARVSGVELHAPDLEAVFLELTGRGLRD